MDETVICALDEGPAATSTAAFGVWLGDCTGTRPFVCRASATEQILAVAAEHRAGAIVVGAGSAAAERAAIDLLSRFRGTVVALPPAALELWRDPFEARRRMGRAIVLGTDGSSVAVTAARIAGRVAAGLGGKVVVAHAADGAGNALRRALITSSLEAAGLHGAPVHGRLASGGVAETLSDLAAAERAPMVAVGTTRASAETYPLAGSVTAEMLGRGEHPLLITAGAPGLGAARPRHLNPK